MEAVHDLGGMQGFGPIDPEPDESPFHAPWEGRVHGTMLSAVLAGVMPPGFRYAIERMDPVEYLTSSYYEHWIACMETLFTESGLLTREELGARAAELASGSGVPQRQDPELAGRVRMVLRPFPVAEETEPSPRFSVGDRVRVRRFAPSGHTRCPRYVRGADGVVVRIAGVHPVHDARVMQGVRRPEAVYAVSFRATDLWELEDADDHDVIVELWESYLEEEVVP